MKKKFQSEGSYDFFSGEKIENILLLGFKQNLMFFAKDLIAKKALFDFLDMVSEDKTIKVIVILNPQLMAGSEEYTEFYNQVLQSKMPSNDALRMLNAVDQFIIRLRELNQIIIYAHSGKVLSMLLYASLACDYRIAADNAVFQNPSPRFGLAPKGGGAFFLSKMLGNSKAFEILLSEHDIEGSEALRLGLIDKVVPQSELKGQTMKIAENYARKPASTLRCVKRLLNYNLKDLEEYLAYETQEIKNIIRLQLNRPKQVRVI